MLRNKIHDFHEIDRSRRPDRVGISYLILIPNGTSHSLHRSTEPILVHIISFFELRHCIFGQFTLYYFSNFSFWEENVETYSSILSKSELPTPSSLRERAWWRLQNLLFALSRRLERFSGVFEGNLKISKCSSGKCSFSKRKWSCGFVLQPDHPWFLFQNFVVSSSSKSK